MIIGVDEAGRGALAGPVVAAAVVLDPAFVPDGVADSKVLAPRKRELVAAAIRSTALAWAVAEVDHQRIDDVNVLQATYDAMHLAIEAVLTQVQSNGAEDHLLLIDGNRFRPHAVPHRCIVGGDALEPCISAASILAKTHRDAWMVEVAHRDYPSYGFDRHKGYGTAAHRQALRVHGPCALHRTTFLRSFL